MARILTSVFAAILVALSTHARVSAQSVSRSALHDFRVVTVADGLIQPWSIAFLPGGDMLVTERPGRLRIVRNGKLLPDPVPGLPPILVQGQGGLLEVAPHPNFASNRVLYLTYAKPILDGKQGTTALARARFENDRLVDLQQIFESVSQGRGHYGGKIAFDRNGYLFLTLGDRQVAPAGNLEAHPAQDLTNHHGKMIRLHDDGRVPADNPFVNRPGAKPEIWSYGHRNVQGLAIHPDTGDVWTNEHGPQGGDELNRVQAGANYGWPVIGFGVNYQTGLAIHQGTHREGMQQPVHAWIPSIGVSGLMIYTGDRFPQWRGSFFAGGMASQYLSRITIQGPRVTNETTLTAGPTGPALRVTGVEILATGVGRVRDVRQGPDGFIYLAIEDREGKVATPVVRLEPVARAPITQ